MQTWKKLRALRKRARLSQDALAKAIGMAGASSYSRYEQEDGRASVFLPIEMVEQLAQVLTGQGTPPIARAEVMELAGASKILNVGGAQVTLPSGLVVAPVEQDIPLVDLRDVRGHISRLSTTEGSNAAMPTLFRVRVADNSLLPDFARDEELVCDAAETPRPGDFVLSQMADEPVANVRRYAVKGYSGGKPVVALVPLNPSIDAERIISVENPGEIYGRIVEHRRRL
jgi:transcriptional regulator with XRE-family HTH domain